MTDLNYEGSSAFSCLKAYQVILPQSNTKLTAAISLAADGRIKAAIVDKFSLDQITEAYKYSEQDAETAVIFEFAILSISCW